MRIPFIFTIRILIWLAPFILFSWTIWQNVPPSGVFEVSYDFEKATPFITSLLPGDRALAITRDAHGMSYQSVVRDPVYFRVRLPRRFDRASIEVTFQNYGQPILELGGLAARNPDTYDLHPLENVILDGLDWPRLEVDGLEFYQRRERFESIPDFLANLPAPEEIATYQVPEEFWGGRNLPTSRLTHDIDLDRAGINYVLARYEPPRREGEWKIARSEFDLSKLLWDDRKLVFVISAPGIAERAGEVRISKISGHFERPRQSATSLIRELIRDLPH